MFIPIGSKGVETLRGANDLTGKDERNSDEDGERSETEKAAVEFLDGDDGDSTPFDAAGGPERYE